MDLFRFTNPSAPTLMQQGVPIIGVKSAMWIERYREAGEFEIEADLSTGIRKQLPVGSFLSHVNSDEIMIVENHELSDDGDEDQLVKVSGRSFESYLEQRIVGSDRVFPSTTAVPEYTAPADNTWTQLVYLIRNHTISTYLNDVDNAIPYFQVTSSVTGTGVVEDRPVKRGDLYTRTLEILAVDNLGIRTIRPGRTGGHATNITLNVHRGVDRAASVMFSQDSGEIERADYLWSNKKVKNAAYVAGNWVDVWIDTPASGYGRRVLYVDASELDQSQQAYPTGTARDWIVSAMQIRGRQALAAQKEVALAKAEVSKEYQLAVYRQDYNVGDIVTASGNYNESSKMRVSEYVEIEDDDGTRGYPTLEIEDAES